MGLVQVVLAIALSSAVTGMTVSVLSSAHLVERSLANDMRAGFESLEQSWHSFQRDHRTFTCKVDVPDTQCPGFSVLADGVLPLNGWSDTLFTEYGFSPNMPGNFSVSYLNDGTAQGFCSSGTGNTALYAAAKRFQSLSSKNKVHISQHCGINAPVSVTDPEASWAVTYWISSR